ncbi:MAG: phosphatidylserine/phosphatidylglycerophosphate/cardiolipin synthase family protein [Myxococcota bacterium]|nr:phosphatidylserine/phosphatidylglycerophosphate/cardiolipin synthase family protein [Myxococcota bacterium]
MLVELGADATAVLGVLRALVPKLEQLVVAVWTPTPSFAGLALGLGEEPGTRATGSLEALGVAAAEVAASARVQLVPELGSAALADLCASESIDLLVEGSRTFQSASALYELRRSRPLPVLFAQGPLPTGPDLPIFCFALGHRARASLRAFLRDHADPSMHVTLLGPDAPSGDELTALLEIAGIQATLETANRPGSTTLRRWIADWVPDRPARLLVFAQLPALALLGAQWPAPVLLLPPPPTLQRPQPRPLDVADLTDDGGPLWVRLDQAAAVGDLPAIPDQPITFVSGGKVLLTRGAEAGALTLDAGLVVLALGVYRAQEHPGTDPVEALEQRLRVLRPGKKPLILFDAELPDTLLRRLPLPPAELLAVRLRPTQSCDSLRERLHQALLLPRVIDARTVLDEGEALDVSEELDPVRLARVAQRLRKGGFPVVAIVHRGSLHPSVQDFTCWNETDLLAARSLPTLLPPPPPEEAIPGNRVELEFDNRQARLWLLDAIAHSRKRVHLQVYMALDDDAGAPVETALAEAGARGVQVRVLVDSLHGLHGSFGARNPLLDRLAGRPGVELRTSRPITELPSLSDLKLRDHRKLVVVDGELALVGGRNLSHEYYAGFEEVPLAPHTPWREVPWLDAGARVQGPAVAAVDASFRDAWIEAGGASFPRITPAPAGPSSARVVLHHGLRDARTLETYLELIATARSHLYAVNGFPFLLELQHAFLQALRRGVQVRVISGHLVPTHGGQPFKGPLASARAAATELVHSRLDPLIAQGAQVFLYRVPPQPQWAPEVGPVQPHVHAKVLSVDGKQCAVGSANLDVTASYWESELMLLVEDPQVVRGYEARIEALIATSVPLRKDDPAWQELAQRRAWMRHWPGVLSV